MDFIDHQLVAMNLIFATFNDSGGTLEQIAQRGSGGPIPGNTQGQVGQGSEQPGLVEDVPAQSRRVGLHDL